MVICSWHNHGIFFSIFRIYGLHNISQQGIGPWYSMPNKELLHTAKIEGDKKMSVSE